MQLALLYSAALLAVVLTPSAGSAQKAAPDSIIQIEMAVTKPAAIEKVMAVMSGAGLQITQSEPTGLVVGIGEGPRNTTVAYSATILTVGDSSRAVLSAVATSKASMSFAGTSFTPQARVTSKTKGGAKVWTRLQQLADSLRAGM
jgi:hypothetical protein